MNALLERTIADVHADFLAGRLTVRRLVEAYQQRIAAFDQTGPGLNAIVNLNPHALGEADALDRAFTASGRLCGPLHGIPLLAKDNIDVAGVPMTNGLAAFRDYVPARDATAVARLRAAGALIIGKTTLPDFASSWWAYSSLSGETRNPYDLARDPGGSSAGSGAATAANYALGALGTDCGGSIRVPASCNSLVGIRGTPGLVSRTGSGPLVVCQDTVGPMTRTVEDAARLFEVMAGFDPTDAYTAAAVATRAPHSYVDLLDLHALRGARVGLVVNALGADSDPYARPVNALVREGIEALRAAGAAVIEVDIPDLTEHLGATSMYVTCSRHAIDSYLAARPELPLRSLEEILARRAYHPMLDLLEACGAGPPQPERDPDYFRRLAAREAFAREVLNVFGRERLDTMIYPTLRVVPPRRTELAEKVWTTLTFPTNTLIASQTWLPAASVPAGLTGDGLPVGLEFLVRPYDEASLFRYAYAFEQTLQGRRPPASTPDIT